MRGDCGRPIIRLTDNDCVKPNGLRELDNICRTLPVAPVNSFPEDMYQFEDLSAVLDEDNAQQILDNLKDNGA